MEASRQEPLRRGRLFLALLLAAAAAVRLAAALALPETRFPDSGTYEQLAVSIRESGELKDAGGNRATVAPGYPLFIAACRATLGESKFAYRIPQFLLGVGTVLGIYLLARRLWGERAGLAAGALAAVDPFAVYFETLELSEGPALCLLVWTGLAAWHAREKLWAAPSAGALVGLTALVRPGWLLIGATLLVAGLVLGGEKRPNRRAAAVRGLLAAGALLLVMSPWWVRNYYALKAFVPLATGSGQSLYEGNSPNATGGPAVPQTVFARLRGEPRMGELARNRLLGAEARRWIAANPGRFAELAVVKFGRTWSPMPNEAAHRRWYHVLPSVLAWAAVLALAAVGLLLTRGRRGRAVWCLLPALAVVVAHLFIIGSVRYRMPAWPFLEVLAGWGLAALVCRYINKRKEVAG